MAKTKMTQEEALQKATVLVQIISDSINEFNELNYKFGLGLDLSDDEIIQDFITESAEDQDWNSSSC